MYRYSNSVILTLILLSIVQIQCFTSRTNVTVYKFKRSLFGFETEQPLPKTITDIVLWIVGIIPRIISYSLASLNIIPKIHDNVSIERSQNLSNQYSSGVENEDIHLDIMQLINKYGFAVEKHRVQTNDGYILTMFRIPLNGSTCLLMHSLLSSSDDWVTAGPNSGIAYILASEGYDVWLGNSRGNKHSRQHISLSPNEPRFWDFSWDEIGRYDLPAMIDYILDTTGQTQLKYVGHSQGTTAFFVMCSEKPEYNDKVSLMVALSAVAWMSHLKSPVVRLLSPVNPFLHSLLRFFGIYEFLPNNIVIQTLKTAICGTQELAKIICTNIVFIISGFNYAQLNVTNLPVFFSHVPSGAATKQLVHYGQGVVSGQFQRYDYGEDTNRKIYGSRKPPAYPVDKITAPVAIFYSEEDWLADIVDVKKLRGNLKNVVEFFKIPDKNFNHLDFIWAKDVRKYVCEKLLQLFNT